MIQTCGICEKTAEAVEDVNHVWFPPKDWVVITVSIKPVLNMLLCKYCTNTVLALLKYKELASGS